jgi:CelD/BcsL family acetyltransferase involved in cellulose biosynthesis
MPALRIEIAATSEELDRLRGPWEVLLRQSPSDTIFLTWEWASAWWRHLHADHQLHVISVWDGEVPVAIAPLIRRRRDLGRLFPFRTLGFIGSGGVGSEYLDVIVQRGREEEGVAALAGRLRREGLVLELNYVRPTASIPWIVSSLRGRGWRFVAEQTAVAPFIDLSGHTWESYLGSLGSEHRYQFRRKLRNLERRFQVELVRVHDDRDRGAALKVLVDLHRLRWTGRGGSNALHAPALVAFHEEFSCRALERGWLRLFMLRLDGLPAAALYGFRYGDAFLFYQSGFDPAYSSHSVGLVLMGLAIREALAEGAREFDLLRGEEAYKAHWARGSRRMLRWEVYPPGWRGSLSRELRRFRRSGRQAPGDERAPGDARDWRRRLEAGGVPGAS